jgi:L-alanine-DL-glutamate epimerase-like enolase superfamily enzyme
VKVRAGVEMALIDAAANSVRIPLWRLFGGNSNSITTDITVKYCFYFNIFIFKIY